MTSGWPCRGLAGLADEGSACGLSWGLVDPGQRMGAQRGLERGWKKPWLAFLLASYALTVIVRSNKSGLIVRAAGAYLQDGPNSSPEANRP